MIVFDCQFLQFCESTGELRSAEVAEFLSLLRQAFGLGPWSDENGSNIDTMPLAVENVLRTCADGDPPSAVATFVASTRSAEVGACIITGGARNDFNFFAAEFRRNDALRSLDYFRRSIALFAPREAYILDRGNDEALQGFDKHRRYPELKGPAVLHWFHFFGAGLANAMGGVEFCLQTPAYKVERFLNGVLFQITEDWFDHKNPRHREAQMAAMRHFGLDKLEIVPITDVALHRVSILGAVDRVTEELWNSGAEPRRLIERARRAYRITDRKLWLFTTACLRRNPEQSRMAPMIELLEKLADSELSVAEVGRLTSPHVLTESDVVNRTADSPRITLNNISQLLDAPFEAAVSAVSLDVSKAKGIDTFEGRLADRNTFGAIVRDIFPNPFRRDTIDRNWRTPEVVDLARMIYQSRSFDRMGELAAALQAAGCRDEHILSHCHTADPHYRGCWLIDMVLGKE